MKHGGIAMSIRRLREQQAREETGLLLAESGPLFPWREELALALTGSAVTEYADEFASLDLLVLCPDEQKSDVEAALAGGSRREDRRPHFEVVGREELARAVQNAEDGPLYLIRHLLALHDPRGELPALIEAAHAVDDGIWRAKIEERYRSLRQRKASLAWAVRRGQPFVLLDSLNQFLGHAFTLCCYLERRPPAPRKWLFASALRTPAGQNLRPVVYELFSSLGEVATLGGSYDLRDNRLYNRLSAIQETLERAMGEAGVLPAATAEKGG